MKQLKTLVKPKRRTKTYTIEQLQEVLDDLLHRGVQVNSIGILLVGGLVYSFFHDKPKYEKMIKFMTNDANEGVPVGFSWE